jgi:amidase
MPVHDTLNAFVAHGRIDVQTSAEGPLAGLSFAVKDFFDIAGLPTAAGSPDWLATHPVPTVSTPVYDRLLAAGAKFVGKTHTDELAWSLNGENAHYGTPVNPAAQGRIPGGSSSGSAAATAGGLVDFAIGSDTGGSVRLPASYCGIYGIRTTHARIPLTAAVPLAPSYDTAGWFARSPQIMEEVGKVLLDRARPPRPVTRLLIARDLFAAVDPKVSASLQPALQNLIGLVGDSTDVDVAAGDYPTWRNVFRLLQSEEAWAAHGAWIEAVKPKLGPGVKERFAAAAVMNANEIAEAKAMRKTIVARTLSLMTPDTALVLPTSPGIAPLLNTPADQLDQFRAHAIELLCLAGHAGLPQVSIPAALLHGCPLGLSIIGGRDCDEDLLALAVQMGQA